MSSSTPRLRKGQTVTPTDLATLARSVLADVGATHRDAADALGTKHPAITRALSTYTPGVDICTRLIERYTDFTVAGPVYRIEREG